MNFDIVNARDTKQVLARSVPLRHLEDVIVKIKANHPRINQLTIQSNLFNQPELFTPELFENPQNVKIDRKEVER